MATDFNSTVHDSSLLLPDPIDPRAGLMLNTYLDGSRLIGFAQPTAWTNQGIQIARLALQTAHLALVKGRYLADLSVANRLERAMQTANESVCLENKKSTGHDHTENIGIGMALVLRSGKLATISMTAPIQVVVLQNGLTTWLPKLESWIGDDPGIPGKPLGWADRIHPTIATTVIAHGDEIVLTTDTVGEALARKRISCDSSELLCEQIAGLARASSTDPIDITALATRFVPESLTGNILSASRHVLGDVDRRARTVWAALRSSEPPVAQRTPSAD